MKSFFGDPKFALQKVLFHLSLQRSPSGNKAALLLLGSPHLLGDAILSPSHWDLLLIDSSTGRGINFKPKQKVSVDRLLRSFKNTMSSFHFSPQYLHAPEMVSDVIADTFYRYFRCSLTALLSTLDYSRIYGEESNPSGIIWEFPPVCHPHGAVFLAGLRALWPEIPVWGCQGGGIDGLQDQKGRLEEVQFRYCNRFFSFGHNLEDLIELGYDPASLPTIIPSGWPKISPSLKRIKRNRRPVDLLFPLTNIPHYAIVNHPSVTFINQIKILSLLENFVDKTIVAKPYPFAKDHTACSVINLLRKLKHVRTCWDMSLCQWLRQYHPQAIVLEISSTPLLEVLSEDAEILLLHDPVIPYTKHALSLLTRRVHYCYTLEELLDTLHKWRAGELPRKRDDSFFKKYVFRPDSKEIIQQDIASHLLKTHVRSTPPRKNGHLRRKNG
ncbi:MAG: hypothetical protein D6679_02620 [Candidatus Hydrogenedentota bacterium]|nr:MAG: hypothetical protein D6679_02620 [Candidatus Hydrogenedentota bacterium]